MIDYVKGMRVFNGEGTRIKEWTVYFQTPFGLCATMAEAVDRLRTSDLDPQMCIVPVAAAITVDGTYEVSTR